MDLSRRRLLQQERDRRVLEGPGIRGAATAALRARVVALRVWEATGQVPPVLAAVRAVLMNTGFPVLLARGMAAGHLAGLWRARLDFQRYAPVRMARQTKISRAYADAIRTLRRKLEISDDDVDRLTSKYGQWATREVLKETESLVNRIDKTLRRTIQEGRGVEQGTAALRRAFTLEGVTPASDHALATIFRTQVQVSYNAARMQALQDPEIQDSLWGFEYVTMDDQFVRPTHAAMQSVRRPKDDPIWLVWTPPNGYNCRCSLLEIYGRVRSRGKLPDFGPDPGFDFYPPDLTGLAA